MVSIVVGVVLDGVARAYPVEGLTGPINDEVGGDPIVVFPTEGGANSFSAVVDGETLEFRHTDGGLVDTATGSVWTAPEVAVSGPHAGTTLELVPSRTTFWFAFVGAFPDVQIETGS